MSKTESKAEGKETVEFVLKKEHGLLAVALILFVASGIMLVLSQTTHQERAVALWSAPSELNDINAVAQKAVDWINAFFKSRGISATATLLGAAERHGLIEVNIRISGGGRSETVTHYVTTDGTLLLPQAIDITQKPVEQKEETQPEIPKSDRPKVELFVMSYCPFGLQAEKAMIPVIELLGDKISFTVRFVDYVMHGPKEMWENLRQYCIEHNVAPDKYFTYLKCFVQSGNYRECLSHANISEKDVNACMERLNREYNIEGLLSSGKRYPPFPLETTLNKKYGVRGSPTLVINGVTLSAPRSPEGLKGIICSAFTSPPPECNVSLSSDVVRPGFGPITERGGSSGGSCR